MPSARNILFALFAFFAAGIAANADVVIDRCSEIVVSANAAYATRLAAEELNFFLKGVLGEALPVVGKRTDGKTAIVLGGEPVPLNRDEYVIEADTNVLRIFGNDDDVADVNATAALPGEAIWQPCFRRGTLFGVYAFLERFAGVRMYFPGELGTCVPSAERIAVPEGRIVESPAFSVRRYGYEDGPVAKEILARMNETDFKRLNWYRLRMETYHLRCCHGAKTHCLSPETWDAIFTNACAVIAANGAMPRGVRGAPALPPTNYHLPSTNHQLIDAMPKDGLTWVRHCNCNWCMKNVPFSKYDIGFATDLVWRRTAELAGRIAWHAKLGRKVSLWNYPDKVGCWNLEMKDIPQIAPRAWASYYRAVAPHVTGAFAESESDRWIYNYLNYYVFSRICWNPDADVEAILAEHHRLMFGAAAKEMAEFFDTLEKCWMKVVAKPYDTPLGPGVCEAPTEEEMRGKIYSPEVLARLKSFVSSASSKVAEGSIEARRIALFTREYLEPLCRR